MPSFFRKPFVYTALFSGVLAIFFLYTLLLVFVIPRSQADVDYETVPPDRFEDVTVDVNWGNMTDSTEEATAPHPFETADGETAAPETEDPDLFPDVDEPIITDTLYADRNMRVELTEIFRYESILYVAEVRIKDPSLLKTALAQDKFGLNIKETTSSMANRLGAVLAVNGDFYGSNESGYVIRNGKLYRDTLRPAAGSDSDLSYFDDLAIMRDGSFVTFDEARYSAHEVLEKGAMHVLAFGPTLVLNGEVAVDKNTEVGLAFTGAHNPRCAIGVVKPGHYFFIVADGRCDESIGPSLWELAHVFKDLGATTAYNLDGGGSATMVFNGRLVNNPHTNINDDPHERRVSDCVYIGY